MTPRVLSGVQPSGNLHIGNYLGAIKNWVRIQHDYESIFCVVDLHAITNYQKPDELRASIRDLAALYLAAGIDPKHSHIVVQSSVPAHAELAWLLTCVTPMGWLERMTQFKAKMALQESVGDGIFQYPVLMAADILLYQAAIVPVGEDQSQHLELTRDIAQRFNSLYGETFVMPATKLPTVGARIMGLDDPTAKMSKSATGSGHAVALLDPPERIKKTIMRATTGFQHWCRFRNHGAGRREPAEYLPGVRRMVDRPDEGSLYGDALRRFEEAGCGDGGRPTGTTATTLSRDHVRTRLSGRRAALGCGDRDANCKLNCEARQRADGSVHLRRLAVALKLGNTIFDQLNAIIEGSHNGHVLAVAGVGGSSSFPELAEKPGFDLSPYTRVTALPIRERSFPCATGAVSPSPPLANATPAAIPCLPDTV